MTRVPVHWLNYHEPEVRSPGMWDQTIVEWVLGPKVWSEHYARPHLDLEGLTGAVVVIPGRFHAADLDRINEDTARLRWVVYIVCSDEENLFPVEGLTHRNRTEWVQTADPKRHDAYRWLPVGPTPHSILGDLEDDGRRHAWSFAGQITHPRRLELEAVLQRRELGYFLPTKGFTQGLPPDDYRRLLVHTKIVPCPSGPATVDTFRLYEALDAGCVPIVETDTPDRRMPGYWPRLFGPGCPIPVVESWYQLDADLPRLLAEWDTLSKEVRSWWLDWRTDLRYQFWASVAEVGGLA